MKMSFKVTEVKHVATVVRHRDQEDETATIEHVLLEAVGGTPWRQSAAGQLRMSVDDPHAQGYFVEGDTVDVTVTRQA